MTESELVELLSRANAYLTERQDALRDEYGLGSYERFDVDQESCELVFSNAGIPQLVAEVQYVGSISTETNTWLWSWANDSIEEQARAALREVRRFGALREVPPVLHEKWEADEVDGWEMTALAAYVLRAKGAYRTQHDDGFTYLLLINIRKTVESEARST